MSEYRYLEYRFDADRVNRAKELEVLTSDTEGVTLPEHHYMVTGGNQPHYVTTKPHPDCDCHDFNWGHDRLCKHLIASLYHEGDMTISHCMESGDEKTLTVMETTILAGPPFGGQSFYVEERATKGDFVWQYDLVMPAITVGLEPYGMTVTTKEVVRKMRNAAIDALVNAREHPANEIEHAWIVGSYPSATARHNLASRLRAEVVVFETDPHMCGALAQQQGLDRGVTRRVERYAEKWWEAYTQHPNDIVRGIDIPEGGVES